jgi:hypothetical protein
MEEVKMMMSHDKQHFVNTIKNKKEHYNHENEGGISSLNKCSAMPLCIELQFLVILIHPHIIYKHTNH